MKRRVPYTERHGSVTIHGGDGSRWLAELQQEQSMPQYQTRGMPSRTRQHDHTRFAKRTCGLGYIALGTLGVLALFALGLFVAAAV